MMKKSYISHTMIVVKLQHRSHLMIGSTLNNVKGNADLDYGGSDAGYEGDVRGKESSGIWDSEW